MGLAGMESGPRKRGVMNPNTIASGVFGLECVGTGEFENWREIRSYLKRMREAGHIVTITHGDGRQHLIHPDRPIAYSVGGVAAYRRWIKRGDIAPGARYFKAWHARTGAKLPGSATAGMGDTADTRTMGDKLEALRKAVG